MEEEGGGARLTGRRYLGKINAGQASFQRDILYGIHSRRRGRGPLQTGRHGRRCRVLAFFVPGGRDGHSGLGGGQALPELQDRNRSKPSTEPARQCTHIFLLPII